MPKLSVKVMVLGINVAICLAFAWKVDKTALFATRGKTLVTAAAKIRFFPQKQALYLILISLGFSFSFRQRLDET